LLQEFTSICTAVKFNEEALKLATFKNLAGDDIDTICQAKASNETSVSAVNFIMKGHLRASKNTDKLTVIFRQAKKSVGEVI
jgi:hypothetical protein